VGEAELFEYAVGALSRRMRSVRDLRRLMKPRAREGEEGERDMDRVVERLVELNYLSDTRFAEDYTRIRMESQGFGRRRVAQDLAVKGIAQELAATTLSAAYDEADEVALARAYCAKKRIQRPIEQKEVARVMNRLLRAGYSSTAIFKLFRAWQIELPAESADDYEPDA
jgi:regulatory protein